MLAGGVACSLRSARGYNLLLITLDTVRADRLGAYGYAAAETPTLDALARAGVRFESASAVAPLTLPSHATLLSGLLPPQHGLRNNGAGAFPKAAPVLAAHLAAAGYRTGAFVGAFVLDHRFGLDRGFERYDDEIERDPMAPSGLAAERAGLETVDRAVAWLGAETGRPFFAWVHLYDAHAPYEPREPFRTRHAGQPYDGEIAGVDDEVAHLLHFLDERGLASRTVVAVVGDHGESLGEHREPTHGLFVYEATLHVPWILRAPRVLRSRVVHEAVSLVDLAPTLAGLLEQPLPVEAGQPPIGRDLSAGLRAGKEPASTDIYAESQYPRTFGWAPLAALRRDGMKLVAAPRPELYDLAADPREEKNLAAGDARRPALEARLATFVQGALATRYEAGPDTMDAAARERLASLGYAGGTATPSTTAARGRDPKDVVSLFREFEWANAALQRGRREEAESRLTGLVEQDPGNAVFRGRLAQVYREQGDMARAVPLYRQAAQDAPGDADARYNLGMALHEAGHSKEAVAALDEAIGLDPSRAEVHNARGVALLATARSDQALSAFDQAVVLDPRDARAHNNRGNVLRQMGRFDEAEEAYRRAAELAPRYADPLNGLGSLEVDRDRPREALPYFDQALARAPGFHEARLNRGIALEMAGDKAAAAAAYRAFLEAAKDDRALVEQKRIARGLLARLGGGTTGAAVTP
jgi:arylsulfatase A-like enzyme/tetratricopeptide (TPR) repeat protein